MTIRIVTDSTCDLPEESIAQYDISIVPLYIHIGHDSYVDRTELSREQFYRELPNYPSFPKTAAPSPATFQALYERLAAEGATEILSIHISSSLSAMVNQANLAAQATTDIPVTVFDSTQLSLGVGYLVLKAAELAAGGATVQEIVSALEKQAKRTYVFAVVDTFEYLRRSGRVSWLVSGIGELLQIKPLLKMHDGQATSERIRTYKRAYQRIIDLITESSPLERIDFVYTDAASRAVDLSNQVQHLCPPGQTPGFTRVTPVIGAHIGPGCFGAACVRAADTTI